MKKLLEIQNQYIEEMNNMVAESKRLLTAARHSLSNRISNCKITGCTLEKPCRSCRSWDSIWKEIEEYIDD